MKKLSIPFLLLLLSFSAIGQWRDASTGFKTGYVRNLFITSDGTLYATGEESFFRFKDNNWERVALPQVVTVDCFAELGGKILVGTKNNGIYQSDNQGQTWSPIANKLVDSLSVSAIIMADASTFLANVYHTGHQALGGSHSRIYISRDKGVNWELETQFDNKVHNQVYSLVMGIGDRVIAATTLGIVSTNIYSKPLSWTKGIENKPADAKTPFVAKKIIHTGRGVLIALPSESFPSYGSFYRSDDNGDTWVPIQLNNSDMASGITDLVWSERGAELYASTFTGVFRVSFNNINNGNSWSKVSSSSDYFNNIVLSTGRDVYSTSINGILKLSSGAADWVPLNTAGLKISYTYSMYANRNIILAVTENGLYSSPVDSLNNIFNWKNVPDVLRPGGKFSETKTAFIAPSKKGEIYIGTNSGFIKSKDLGKSWDAINPLIYKNASFPYSEVSYQAGIQALLPVGDNLYASGYEAPFVYNPATTKWEQIEKATLKDKYTSFIGSLPFSRLVKGMLEVSGEVYLILEDYSSVANNGHDVWTIPDRIHLYKFDTGKVEWTRINTLEKSAKVHGITVIDKGLIISTESLNGTHTVYNVDLKTSFSTWQPLTNFPLTPADGFVKYFYNIDGKLFLTTTKSQAILVSSDGGLKWTRYDDTPFSISAFYLNGNRAYAGLTGNSIYYRPLAQFLPPDVSVNDAQQIKATTAEISGTVSAKGGFAVSPILFEYADNQDFTNKQTAVASPSSVSGSGVSVKTSVAKLAGNTSYWFRLAGSTADQVTVTSSVKTFTTAPYANIDTARFNHIRQVVEANPSAGNKVTTIQPDTLVLNQYLAGTQVKLFTRSLTRDNWKDTTLNSTTRAYPFTLPINQFDELGLAYYFKITPPEGYLNPLYTLSFPSDTVQVAIRHPQGLTLPFLHFGRKKEDYQMVSFPLELDNAGIKETFEKVLGAPDRTKWRLLTYDEGVEGKWSEYQGGGITTGIQPGVAYWLAVADPSVAKGNINSGKGNTVVRYASEKNRRNFDGHYYTIKLKPGYNQIGNPFNLIIKWKDVHAVNPTIGSLIVYQRNSNNELVRSDNDTTRLMPFGGGYVQNKSTGVVDLKIPARRNVALNGARISTAEEEEHMPMVVHFTLKSNEMICNLAGLGMHPAASAGADQYDLPVPPALGDFPTIRFTSPVREILTRSIVPVTEEGQSWEFTVSDTEEGQPVEFSWAGTKVEPGKQLWLHDLTVEKTLDMLSMTTTSFTGPHRFRVYYGSEQYLKEHLMPVKSLLEVYPNPFVDQAIFRFTLPKAEVPYPLKIRLLNSRGQYLFTLHEGMYEPGFHQAEWNSGRQGVGLTPGMYLLEMEINTRSGVKTYYQKTMKR